MFSTASLSLKFARVIRSTVKHCVTSHPAFGRKRQYSQFMKLSKAGKAPRAARALGPTFRRKQSNMSAVLKS